MSNFTTTLDIVNNALFRAGEGAIGSGGDYEDIALQYINEAYIQICRGGSALAPSVNEAWDWMRSPHPGILTLLPPRTTTVTATQQSTTITFGSAPGTTSVVNYMLMIPGISDLFRIATHTALSTSATLDSMFTGTSQILANATLFLIDYTLVADVMTLIQPMRVFVSTGSWGSWDQGGWGQNYKIYGASESAMHEEYPLARIQSGVPEMFAFVGETTTNQRRVRFSHYGGPTSTQFYKVEYDYLFLPAALTNAANEEPLIPKSYRHVLADFVTAYLYGVKEDTRSSSATQLAQAALMAMAKANKHEEIVDTNRLFRLYPSRQTSRRGYLQTASGVLLT